MWIQVRTFDGKRSAKIDGLSKLTKIEELRGRIKEIFDIDVDKQRLFFSGKQLEDGYTLFDYDVALNAIVQVMERILKPVSQVETESENDEDNPKSENPEIDIPAAATDMVESNALSKVESDKNTTKVTLLPSIGQYKINELVDAQDKHIGAWFEGIVVKVERNDESNESVKSDSPPIVKANNDSFCKPVTIQKQTTLDDFTTKSKKYLDENKENIAPQLNDQSSTSAKSLPKLDENDLLYHVKFEEYDETHILPSNMVRPRARKILEWNDFEVGDVVMANYNIDKPRDRGFWYDCIVIDKCEKRRQRRLNVQILLGPDKTLEPCRIVFLEEIFHIEEASCKVAGDNQDVPEKRKTMFEPDCSHCNDRPDSSCKECGCHVCGAKKDFDKTLLCDECNLPFHTFCLDPPLDSLPDVEEWYCPLCRNDPTKIVMAGEKLKLNKKKAKMRSAMSTTQRDWGKGMACVGRSKICSLVPSNHFGPIPGVPVGSLWKFRLQVSEAGVHRPHVSGIHGKGSDACYSIVLAGGYEDDEDNGYEFTYTGSGGRDLSGNKRTAEQSCDQVLTKNNLSIAKSCNAKLDIVKGNTSDDWKKGSPIRVVRNYKGAKHSKYAPEDGNRYDGIYKVVKYWPEKGKSGFKVWRYLFRRDDLEPAPWTKEGRKRAKELGLVLQYPDGYLEAQASKLNETNDKGTKKKRTSIAAASPSKKVKVSKYIIPKEVKALITSDEKNEKSWNLVVENARDGQAAFFKQLEEVFMCICCQDVVYQPITTDCKHNICSSCLRRSFSAEVHSCPTCRYDLGKDYKFQVNQNLQQALLKLLPGYGNGR